MTGTMIDLEHDGVFGAYVAQPAHGVPFRGALIVIHEIWGLVEHTKDVADRFAAEGYLALAPDLLTRVGITAPVGEELLGIMFSPDEKVRTEGQPRLREAMSPLRAPEYAGWTVGALTACLDHLAAQPDVGGRLGVTGFCFGGSYSFALAAADSRVRAAVPYYGSPPETAELSRISCPVLAFYGDQDANLVDALPGVTTAMAEAGVDFTPVVYENTGHAFFNDTNARTYDAGYAADAWTKTLDFFRAHLG